MSFYENFIMALQSLMAHRMRSILTMLGIIIWGWFCNHRCCHRAGRGSDAKVRNRWLRQYD